MYVPQYVGTRMYLVRGGCWVRRASCKFLREGGLQSHDSNRLSPQLTCQTTTPCGKSKARRSGTAWFDERKQSRAPGLSARRKHKIPTLNTRMYEQCLLRWEQAAFQASPVLALRTRTANPEAMAALRVACFGLARQK